MLGSVFSLASLVRVARSLYQALVDGHEPVYLPPDYPYVSPRERERMAEDFLRRCDVVAGLLDPVLLACRRRIGADVPYLYFTHGDLSAGAWDVRAALPHLTTRDTMLVSCTAEVEIARLLLRNPRVRVVPFAVDPEEFFPLDPDARRAARAALGFGDGDRVVLYSGRVIPEKNVHALLALFETVRAQVPGAHLVLAGAVGSGGKDLERFGVRPVWLPNTFARLIGRMECAERVHTPGFVDTRRLRELYNAADLTVSLTLNPDENFGMSQVESLACGTPVVGTAWGGLQDTIVDGVSGYRVSTVCTRTGVKFAWWEAVNRIVGLLRDDPAREALRARCREAAAAFSQGAVNARVGEVLAEVERGPQGPAEPLRATLFAEEFWAVCDPRWPGAPYRRGERSEALHAALITPFAGLSPQGIPAGEPLRPDDVLSLATPVHVGDDGTVRPDDVFYPFEVVVPQAYREAVLALLEVLREEPAFEAGELAGTGPESAPEVAAALAWMVDAGLVLRTRAQPGWLDPAVVGRGMARPAFCVQRVDQTATDLLVFR